MSSFVQVFDIVRGGDDTFAGNVVANDLGVLTADEELEGLTAFKDDLSIIANWSNGYVRVSEIHIGKPT